MEENNEPNTQVEGFVYSISDKSHENYNCKKCDKKFRYRSEYASHQLIHNSKKKVFPCAMCSLVFITPTNLMKHQQKHDKNGNFACETCTFLTDSLEHLIRHRASHKQDKEKKSLLITETKLSICDKCGKKCTTSHRLKQHMLTHTGEKPYQCKICEKSFHTLDILKNHENTHLQVKPFMCDECGKTFHQASTLATHKLVHSVPKISCEICSTKFRNMAGLKSHMIARHSNTTNARNINANILKCDVCDKSFFRKRDLDRHLRTHTLEKPFVCQFEDCGKTFSDRSNCMAHEKTHNQNKNKCDQCDKEYSYKHDLKKHMLKAHPDDSSCMNNEEASENINSEKTGLDVQHTLGKSQTHEDNDVQMVDIDQHKIDQEEKTEKKENQKISDNYNNNQTNDSQLVHMSGLDEKQENEDPITHKMTCDVEHNQPLDKLTNNVVRNETDSPNKNYQLSSSLMEESVHNDSEIPVSGVVSSNDSGSEGATDSVVNSSFVNGSGIIAYSSNVAIENTMTLGPSSLDVAEVENVVLQTNDEENGAQTIYVVHTESEEEPQFIYVVK